MGLPLAYLLVIKMILWYDPAIETKQKNALYQRNAMLIIIGISSNIYQNFLTVMRQIKLVMVRSIKIIDKQKIPLKKWQCNENCIFNSWRFFQLWRLDGSLPRTAPFDENLSATHCEGWRMWNKTFSVAKLSYKKRLKTTKKLETS